MALKVRLVDGRGSPTDVGVDRFNRIYTADSGIPPHDLGDEILIFRDFLRTSAGSSDMRVLGGLGTPVDFFVAAPDNADRYISSISIVISDAGVTPNGFGAGAALVNGVQMFYSQVSTTVFIHDALRTNFDMIRLCQGKPSFGNAGTVFEVPGAIGLLSDAYIPVLDIKEVFGLPWGIRLRRGSVQRLTVCVRDNIVGIGLDAFNMIAYGFDRLDINDTNK